LAISKAFCIIPKEKRKKYFKKIMINIFNINMLLVFGFKTVRDFNISAWISAYLKIIKLP